MDETGDMGGIASFLFYTMFVYPFCSWIMKPGRFSSKKVAIMYAIAFLALLASVKTGLEINNRETNYYMQMGLTRSSTPMEVKKAYKRMSLELHPDKNKDPNAADQFAHLKSGEYYIMMDWFYILLLVV